MDERGAWPDKQDVSIRNQSPRVEAAQINKFEKPAHKGFLPGPFQKTNTQRLKQMLANGANVEKKDNSFIIESQMHTIKGTDARKRVPPHLQGGISISPCSVRMDGNNAVHDTNPPECSPSEFGESTVLQSPNNQQHFLGLKPARAIEKIKLKAISAERKRNLHDKLQLQKFKLRLSKMEINKMNQQAPVDQEEEVKICQQKQNEETKAGQAREPDYKTAGLQVSKQSPRRVANLTARDSPEPSEISISSVRKPDRIEKSTLVAEKSQQQDKVGQQTQGYGTVQAGWAVSRKQMKLNAFKMEVPEITKLETPRAGQDPEYLRGSLNRLTKTKGRHSEIDSPSLYQRSSKAQDVSAGQTTRNFHETEEHELGQISGAIDIQSLPFDNDYAIVPPRNKTNLMNQNSATYKSSSRVAEQMPQSSRQTDPMLKLWNQNNAFLKQRRPLGETGQRDTIILR